MKTLYAGYIVDNTFTIYSLTAEEINDSYYNIVSVPYELRMFIRLWKSSLDYTKQIDNTYFYFSFDKTAVEEFIIKRKKAKIREIKNQLELIEKAKIQYKEVN